MFDHLANPKQRAFLSAYSQLGMIARAARIAKIDRTTHYAWFASDVEYRTAFLEAHKMASDALEDEAIRRAQLGVTEPVVHKGELVRVPAGKDEAGETIYKTLRRRKYSDSLLWSLLQRRKPEYGAAKVEHEHTHEVKGRVSIDWSALSDEELKTLNDIAARFRCDDAGFSEPPGTQPDAGPGSDRHGDSSPEAE